MKQYQFTETPKVYVGTYHKYNSASLNGAWVELTDKDEFLEKIKELHKDESDPEYMFQDFEGFPEGLYSESSINEKLWDWIELDDNEKEIVAVYWDNIDKNADIQDILDCYNTKTDDLKDWAYEFLSDCYELDKLPSIIASNIDFESVAQDLLHDYSYAKVNYTYYIFNT